MKPFNRTSLIITIVITIVGLVMFLFWERFADYYLIRYGLVNGGTWAYLKPINRAINKQGSRLAETTEK
jgi:hypothetical protein